MTNQMEISNRLDLIRLEDVRCEEDDEYIALKKLPQRIDQMAAMAQGKDRDDEAEVEFLTRVVISTEWELSALQRAPNDLLYQRFINSLYTSVQN